MLRINDIKLPLNHAEEDLALAVIERLGIAAADLKTLDIFKRSYDARNKQKVLLIYQVDLTLTETAQYTLLADRKSVV